MIDPILRRRRRLDNLPFAAVAPGGPFYKDLFAGSLNDPLISHTADIGGGYTFLSVTDVGVSLTLDGGGFIWKKGAGSGEHILVNLSTPPSADYVMTYDVKYTGSPVSVQLGSIVRATTNGLVDTFVLCMFDISSGIAYMYEKVAGSFSGILAFFHFNLAACTGHLAQSIVTVNGGNCTFRMVGTGDDQTTGPIAVTPATAGKVGYWTSGPDNSDPANAFLLGNALAQ
jgi:hypothetical protein